MGCLARLTHLSTDEQEDKQALTLPSSHLFTLKYTKRFGWTITWGQQVGQADNQQHYGNRSLRAWELSIVPSFHISRCKIGIFDVQKILGPAMLDAEPYAGDLNEDWVEQVLIGGILIKPKLNNDVTKQVGEELLWVVTCRMECQLEGAQNCQQQPSNKLPKFIKAWIVWFIRWRHVLLRWTPPVRSCKQSWTVDKDGGHRCRHGNQFDAGLNPYIEQVWATIPHSYSWSIKAPGEY